MEITLRITQENDVDHVHYIGPINEEAEVHLAKILEQIGGSCILNFRDVDYVNSCGVRAWINFMRELEKDRDVTFEECVPDIVMQMNMIPSFKGKAVIRSVYGPYDCESCGHSERVLFEAEKNLPTEKDIDLPEITCAKCGSPMEMEELEDEYFAFLQQAS